MILLRSITAMCVAGTVTLAGPALAQDQAQNAAAQQPADASYDATDTAYSLGYSIGQDITNQDMELDNEAFIAGVTASLKGEDPRLSASEMQQAIEAFQQTMLRRQLEQFRAEAQRAGEAGQTQRQQAIQQQVAQMEQMLQQREQGGTNLQQAQQYLEQNRQEPDVQVTDSGLQYTVLEEGDGPSPDASDVVKVHYRGTLLDGTEFDSSYARGEPAEFRVSEVVAGWTEALQKMKVGGKWKLWIPPDLGYGAAGRGPVPPSALMVFEVELLEIVEQN